MPIQIKDYSWDQSDSVIYINLPQKNIKTSDVDILNSKEYCKISYPPYIFECWFYEPIDDDDCSATFTNGVIALQFKKIDQKKWPQLFNVGYESKELMKQARENALVYVKEKNEERAKKKATEISENKKQALKEQMKLEDEDRLRIKSIKDYEKQKATEEIEKFKEAHRAMFPVRSVPAIESANKENVAKIENKPKEQVIDKQPKIQDEPPKEVKESKDIFNSSEVPVAVKTKAKEEIEKSVKEVPIPRQSSTIQVKFTPRVFPTPSRESQEKNEQEWLQNQMESRKLDVLPEELAEFSKEEMDVEWLKDKGNQFYKQGNYQGAINVFNHAVRLFPKMAALYSNRAACHFQVRNLMKCIEDCTRALDLLTPPVEGNAQSRIKAHIRRGTAFCELELYPEGLLDYEAALKIDPNNETIKSDSENIRKIIQGNTN